MANSIYSDFIVRARDQFTTPLRNMGRSTTAFSRNAQTQFGSVSRSFQSMQRLMQFATATIVTGFIGRGIRGLVGAAMDVENVRVQFETLTGSIENANKLIQDMQQFAASTPLQFDTLAEGTQRLLAFGIAQDDVLGALRMLGDAALGDANKLDSLVRAYGKVSARGRASMEEINMVIDAGVPIMAALNEEFGTTTEELTGMISAGEISSDVFTAAFRRMTSEGGQFHNGMQRQSQTTAGLFSTLKDNITLTAASVGEALLPTTKLLTQELITVTENIRLWVDNNRELINQGVDGFIRGVGDSIKFVTEQWNNGLIPALLAGLGTFKILTVAVAVIQGMMVAYAAAAATAAGATSVFAGIVAALGGPVTLIIAGVAALVAGIVLLIKNWEKITTAIKESPLGQFVSRIFGSVSNTMESNGGPRSYGSFGSSQLSNTPTPSTAWNAYAQPQVTESRSTVDINIPSAPPGVTIRQRGQAPGVNMNLGAGVAGL